MQSNETQRSGAPAVGTVVNGYRFDGGNHRERSSWTQVERVDVSGDYGPGAVRYPNGALVRIGPRGGVEEIKPRGEEGDDDPDIKEFQANAAARATLMDQGLIDYNAARADGYQPTSFWNGAARSIEGLPLLGVPLSNVMRSPVADRGRAAELQFTDGALRTTTGANAPEPEVVRADRSYFLAPGESDNVESGKAQLRDRFRNQAVRIAGDAYIEPDSPVLRSDLIGADADNNGIPNYPSIERLTQGVTGGMDTPVDVSEWTEDNPYPISDIRTVEDAQRVAADLARGGWVRYPDGTVEQVQPATLGDPVEGATEVARGVARSDPGPMERTDPLSVAIRNVAAFGQGAAEQVPFMDEAAAYAASRLTGIDYDTAREVQGMVSEADRRERPLARNAGGVAGFAATVAAPVGGAVNAARAPTALGRAVNVGRTALGGGAVGAVYGAGQGETLEERGRNAAIGGVTGAVATPVLNAVAPRVINALAPVVRPVGRAIGGLGERLNVPGSSALVQASAAPNALETASTRLARRRRPVTNVLATRADEQRAMGLDPAFADVTDDATLGTIRSLATRDTPGRDAAIGFGNTRRVEAQGNASDLARRFVSDDPRTAAQVAESLEQTQRTLSSAEMNPIRDAVVAISPETATVFRTPGGRKAIEAARNWTANSRDTESLALISRLADDALDNPGNIELPLGAVDRFRRSLGSQIAQARRAGDGDAVQGLSQLQRAIRSDATSQVPEYRQFLQNYADRAQLDDALEFGGQFMGRRGTAEYARQAEGLLPAQREVARVAVRDSLEDAAGTPAGAASLLDDLSVGAGRNQRMEGLLAADAEEMARVAGGMRARVDVGRKVSPRVGSETNLNQQDTGRAAGVLGTVGDVGGAITGVGGRGRAVASLTERFRGRGFNDNEAQALIEAAIDPRRTDELIQILSSRMSRGEARRVARTARHALAQQGGE